MIPLRDSIPSSATPVVNYLIIAACILVFLAQLSSPTHLQELAFNPHHLVSLRAFAELGWQYILLSLFASMFMHGGVAHIAFNMLFLWIFGDNVEDRLGHLRYAVFYLVCGALATLTHALVSLFASVPVLGASGAIAGVLGAYFMLYRGATVRTLFFLFIIPIFVDIPAVIFLGLWFVFQVLSGLGMIGGAGGGVAFWAHIGGFLSGVWLVRRFAPPGRRLPRPRVLDIGYR